MANVDQNKEVQESKKQKTLEEAEIEVVVFDSSEEFDAMTFR